MTAPIQDICWVVTGGAAGMESQCLGLAERLGLPVRPIRLAVAAPWRWFAPYMMGSPFRRLKPGADRLAPPWPRLFIGCGRQSIAFSLAVKRASSGRTITVQCQNPRIGAENFDLVIPPEHDEISGPHIFPIIGSPNRVSPGRLAQARSEFAALFAGLHGPRVAVLVGGTSKTHGRLGASEARELARALKHIAAGASLMITTSRRTDAQVQSILRTELAGTNAYFWNGTEPNPYLGLLAWADAILVTADSVNMACEAGATGKPVHIFALPGAKAKSRNFQQSLVRRGVARPFRGTIEHWSYKPLDETGRAAERIKSLLDLSAASSDISL